jgi:hypothetical protein
MTQPHIRSNRAVQIKLLERVTIEQLNNYLIDNGWTEEDGYKGAAWKSPFKIGFGTYVSMPSVFDWRGVELVIGDISYFEERYLFDVLKDVLPSAIGELTELRELIADCEQLLSKYGDDFALGQSLESLKARERNLVEEIG